MGRLAARRRARSAAPPDSRASGMPGPADTDAARRRAGTFGPPRLSRKRLARRTAAAAAVVLMGTAGVSIGTQLLTGQPSQAAAARGWAIPQPALRIEDGGSAAGSSDTRQAAAGSSGGTATGSTTRSYRRIILPDLLIVAPQGLTSRDLARLNQIHGVRNMISFDGAQITVGGRSASAIGVNPATFRSWVPLRAASDQALWSALAHGEFIANSSAASRLSLHPGSDYQLDGGTSRTLGYAAGAQLNLSGIDLLVNARESRALGLVHQVAALISAPGDTMARLTRAVKRVLGSSARMETLREQKLPLGSSTGGSSSGLPATYLQLFRESAARYCPGLSWTVLAAIGQIESDDGQNEGPSTAGAMGPMQFEPSTWAVWGTDGFGLKGTPDIMNPYDAVPSAARLLCADGAASGGKSLYNAIFDYNHAGWYVREVLGLAAEYAAEYH